MIFSDFLKTFATQDSPEGDLARHFIQSKSKAKTYTGILRNLQKHHACDKALYALNKIYALYQIQNHKQGG